MEPKKAPALRFKGFSADWESQKISDITTSYSGGTPTVSVKEYYDGEIPFIRSAEINSEKTELFITEEGLNNSSARLVEKGDILYALYGATSGEVGRSRIDGAINQAILAIKPLKNYDADYLTYWLQKSKRNIVATYLQGGQGNLSASIVKDLIIDSPDYNEQQKIGELLRQVDGLIAAERERGEQLRRLRRALLDRLFPAPGTAYPALRLKTFTAPWQQRKLGDIADKVTTKNIGTQYVETFTNSAEHGIISQRDFFDHDVSNIEKIGGYYVVENDDFVYNPRISTQAPVGPIRRNKLGRTGVISPLYTVFKAHDICFDYLEWYFKTSSWHAYMKFNGDSGARSDRFSIKDDLFFAMPIPFPELAEQNQIAALLTSFDRRIALAEQRLEHLSHLKSACLQRLFI